MSQAGILKIPDSILPPDVPTSFVTNVGIAVPILNVLDILGTTIPAGSTPVITTGLGNTVTIEVQRSQAILATDATKIGLAAFNSSEFTVDANGFVSLTGGGGATESFAMQTGTSPVVPTGLGLVTFNGATVLAGTHPVRTDGTGATTMTLEVQLSQALAATDVTKVGLANFDSASFTVDANGFVQLIGDAAAISKVNVQTGTTPIVPLSGAITINGATVAAGIHPVRTDGTGANTMAVEVQISQAIASADVTKIGLSNYSSAQFAVDATGFVTLTGGTTAPVLGVVPDAHTAPGTTPVIPNGSGNIILTGATVAAGTTPIQTNSLAANTVAIQIQIAQAAASTAANKIGLAAFSSADFAVDANGFVTLAGSGGAAIQQFLPDSGTSPVVPNGSGQVTMAGSGSTTTVGGLNTLTFQLTGLTNHAVLVGAGTTTITKIAATATTGQVFQNNASADPSWSTATYPSTTTINQILYSSSANVVGGITAANSAVLVSTSAGVPQWSGTMTNGQVVIGSTGATPTAATLTQGSGITITNGAGSITIAQTNPSGFPWTDVTTATQTLAVNNGYITDHSTTVVYTLPASAVIGDTIKIVGKLGLATITPNANQQIRSGSISGTVGATGTLVSNNAGDCVTIICSTAGASTVWTVDSMIGTWTLT